MFSFREPGDDRSYYSQALVCRNGHAATADIQGNPERREDYCSKCGEATIATCPACEKPIRGRYNVPGVVSFLGYHPPNFCHACGKPLPWTETALDTASAMADELDRLTPEEREALKKTLPDLLRETPRTP
jgi:hypothetical protein